MNIIPPQVELARNALALRSIFPRRHFYRLIPAEFRVFPFEATRGGKASLYPEYQLKIQEMMKQEAAGKTAEAAKKDAGDTKPAKK